MSGYIGSTPVPQATQHRESFTATEGQTSFATAGYTPQFVDVYLNGSHLSPADFTATNGSDVVLGVAASADDVCDIVSYTPFEVADQTFTGTTNLDVLQVDGDVTVGKTTTLISNGTFASDTTGWTASGSTIAVSGAVLVLTPNSGVNGFCSQAFTTVVGKFYIATVTVTQDAGSVARLQIGTSATGNQNGALLNLGAGTHSFNFVATATTSHFILVVGGGGGQVTKFDNAILTEANSVSFPVASGKAPLIKQGNAINDFAINTNSVDRILVTNAGPVIMPTQPALQAQVNGTQSNIAAGSLYTIPFATEIFDQGGNFASNTFTAPVTGKYALSVTATLGGLPLAAEYVQYHIATSNRNYNVTLDPDGLDSSPVFWGFNINVLMDMDASDTCIVKLLIEGSVDTLDVFPQTYLSIHLAC